MYKFITPLLMAALLLMSCNVDNLLPKDKNTQQDDVHKNTAQDNTNENTDQNVNTVSFDKVTFEKERQLWLGQNVSDYSFYLEYQGPIGWYWKGTVTVKDNAVSGFVSELSTFTDDGYGLQWLDTITGIYSTAFSKYQEALEYESAYLMGSKTAINIEYDRTFHFLQHYYRSTTVFPPPEEVILGAGYYEEFWITDFVQP